MAHSHSDFLSWDDDDINLDLLLGDYTDYDDENCAQSEKHTCKSEKSMHSSNDAPCTYVCPSCSKELKSISVFRGHVTKQHSLKDVKASGHRKPAPGEDQPTDNSSKTTEAHHSVSEESNVPKRRPTKNPFIDSDVYPKSYSEALNSIKASNMYNLFGKSPLSDIAELCESNENIKTCVEDIFANLTSEPMNITLVADREGFFSKLHEVRFSPEVTNLEELLGSENCPKTDNISNFVQIFVLEMTDSILKNMCDKMKQTSDDEVKEITENDQNMLFYISGYVAHSLRKKFSKLKKVKEQKLELVKKMTSRDNNSDFIKQYAVWFEKKDRGGLKRPCDDFFLMIRMMETIVRKHVSSGALSSNSLSKCVPKEMILEKYMIKYYSEKLFAGDMKLCEQDDADIVENQLEVNVLEDIINIFLTVRGFSVSRVERSKLLKLSKSKKRDSFRQTLKSKSDCVNK